MEEEFQKAVDFVSKGQFNTTQEQQLRFYGLYKQALNGAVTASKPSFWDFVGKSKWEAWKACENLSKEEAMREYCAFLTTLVSSWNKTSSCGEEQELSIPKQGPQGHGPVFSKFAMANEDDLPKEDQEDIWFFASNGMSNELKNMLDKDSSRLNSVCPGEAVAPLHLACDRGHNETVRLLLEMAEVDVNVRDGEGQTPLHYAVMCGHKDTCKLLLNAGADPNISDNDGTTAAELDDDGILSFNSEGN